VSGSAAADAARARLKEALVRVGAGDRAALRDVYDASSAKLFGVVLRILADRGEAEDVLQDVYLTVWRKADAFDPDRGVSPITWLVALARNRAIDKLRARKDDRNRPIEDATDVCDPAPLASELMEGAADARRLHACLGELEPEHAEYVRRAFFGGLTYQVLAEQAEVPLGTMKSWIRRALMRLRACLET
jgi:RNA polymerase sigma factor (sigma-70 family)